MTVIAMPAVGDRSVVLENASWSLYEKLLSEVQNGGVRLTYDNGRLEIMTLSSRHEKAKTILGRLIEAYADAMGMEAEGYGSTTFRRKPLKCGLEPDECYYVSNAGLVAGCDLDPKRDPPPDLAVEVDISNSSVPKQPIYAALRVSEVWRYDGTKVAYLRLRGTAYVTARRSLSFPKLPAAKVNEFLALGMASTQSAAVRAMRQWLAGESVDTSH